MEDAGSGSTVWPAAAAFCRWLTENSDEICGSHVLELGSGTGGVGIFAAGLGAIVATGGNPIEIVQRAMGGGAQQQNTWVEDDDEEDLFGGFEDTPAPAAEDSAPVDEDE